MQDAPSQWSLFGFDTRHLLQHWLAAWRDVLLAPASPLRRRLDEPVSLDDGNGAPTLFQGGVPLPGAAAAPGECRACLLPESLALTRSLGVPLAAEAELPSVVAMEIRASSPFAADDTASGWCEHARDARSIHLDIALASRSAVHSWLAPRQDADAVLPEVWVAGSAAPVVLQGFGESRRERAYRRRLRRCGGMIATILALLLLLAGLFALQQQRLLQHRQAQFSALRAEAAPLVQARSDLAAANAAIARADALAAQHPDPLRELLRVTRLLEDQAFVAEFSLDGRELRLRGEARNAAAVMQTMAEAPAYERVSAPTPIRAVGNDGGERFVLDIELRRDAGGEGS